jgi:hypothetical protein
MISWHLTKHQEAAAAGLGEVAKGKTTMVGHDERTFSERSRDGSVLG